MTIQAYSPKGDLIVGTSETVSAVALITWGEKGTYEYDGETEILWDSQTVNMRDGKPLFLCRAGHEWTLDQLTFKETAGV